VPHLELFSIIPSIPIFLIDKEKKLLEGENFLLRER
jgi:hypothetical protein